MEDEKLTALLEKLDKACSMVDLISKSGNKNKYRVFSIDEACNYFKIGERRILSAIKNKELKVYKINNRDNSLKQGDIEKWIDSKEVVECELIRYNKIYGSN